MSIFDNYGFNRDNNERQKSGNVFRAYSEANKPKNAGGLTSKIGYTGASLISGVAGIFEGIADIAASATAGDKEYAKYVYDDNRVGKLMQGIRDDINPGTGTSFAGDVATGIGQSSVFLLDALVPFLGTGLFFTGIAGQGIGNAVQQTGELGFKEVGYGVASGALEAVTEKVIGAGGQVVGNLASAATKGAAKTALTKAAAKSGAKNILINVAKAAGGEFAEEFTEEFADVGLKKLFKIDPDAKVTGQTWKDALYSGVVGAISGGLMATPAIVVNYKGNAARGQAIAANGRTDAVIGLARKTQEMAEASGNLFTERKNVQKEERAADTARTAGDKLYTAFVDAKNGRENRATVQFGKAIKDDLDVWDSLTDEQRSGEAGQALLGQIEENLTFHWINGAIEDKFDELMSQGDETLEKIRSVIASVSGREYTLQDVKEDKDGVLSQFAAAQLIEEINAELEQLTKQTETPDTQGSVFNDQTGTQTAENAQGSPVSGFDKEQADTSETQEKGKAAGLAVNPQGKRVSTETGRQVRVKNVKTENGRLVFETEGNELYKSESLTSDKVQWESQVMADAVRAAEEMKMQPLEALYMIKGIEKGTQLSGADYALAYHGEFIRGKLGEGQGASTQLSQDAKDTAYLLGDDYGKRAARERSRAIAAKVNPVQAQKARQAVAAMSQEERVKLPDGMKFTDIRGEGRKAVVTAADIMSKATGMKFEFYQSFQQTNGGERMMVAADGKVVKAPNGWYDTGTGVVHVDLNAGTGADGAAIFTMAHETGHWLMQSDPEAFRSLGEFLFEKMGEDADALIRDKQAFMEANARLDGMSDEKKHAMAYEEVVCDLLSPALKDGNVIEQLAFENKSLFTRVWEHIKNIISNIRDALKSAVGTNQLQKDAADKLEASMNEVEDMFAAALQGAADNSVGIYVDKSTGENVRYSIREEEPPKKTLKGYKVFVVKDGKLYPPMVANPGGNDTPVGVWLNADIGQRAPDSKTGRMQVKAGGKGTQGGGGSLAFRPGWHLGETPLAKQFDRTNPETGVKEMFPENFVWAECEIAADKDYQEEAMSYGYTKSGKFQHSFAGLPRLPVDGYYRYRTNPNPDTEPWLITGAMKVSRLLGDEEVNRILRENGLPEKHRLGGDKTLADLGLGDYEGVRYSDREENFKRWFGKSKITEKDGSPKVVWHQTGEWFDTFDNSRPVAGANDSETPNGYFFKENDHDIGIGGGFQMPMYLRMENPLHFKNREEANAWYVKNVPGYGKFQTEMRSVLDPIMADMEKVEDKMFADISEEEYNRYDEQWNGLMDDLRKNENSYRGRLREMLNQFFIESDSGYDGIILDYDGHRWVNGVRENVKTYIAFKNTQMKAADYNVGTYDPDNPNIRRSDRKSLTTRELLADVTEEEVSLKKHKEFIGRYRELVQDLKDVVIRLNTLDKKKRSKAGLTVDEQAQVRALNEMRLTLDDKLTKLEGLQQAREIIEAVRTNTQKAVSDAQERVERAQREVDEYKEQVRERFERYREKRNAREQRNMDIMRERLEKERNRNEEWRDTYEAGEIKRKTLNVINKLIRELMHPTRDKNIPAVLQPDVVNALEAINTDVTQAEARMTALDEKIAAEMAKDAPDMEQIRIWEKARANIEEIGKTYDKQMSAIQLVYEKIKGSQNSEMRNAYDPGIEAAVNDIANRIRGRSLNQLTLDELKDVRKVVGMVEHLISTYNDTMATERKQRVSDLGEKTTAEIKKVGGEHKTILSALHEILKFGWSQLKPAYAVKVIGSETLQELYNNLVKGEDVWAVDKNEAKQFAESVKEKYGFGKWDLDKVVTVDTQSGKVDLNLKQIMSLYAYSKRPQAVDHLTTGGFVLDSAVTVTKKWKGIPISYDVNIQTPYRITLDDFIAIQRNLTDDQRAFVDDMMSYLSTTLAAKGNEVSRKLYGIDLFNEETYFPIRSARQFIVEENRAKGDPQIKNKGMTKQVTPGAGNPIVLSDFTSVWANHVEEMALYHGLVLPMEDFNRVFNWSSPTGEGVKVALDNAYGQEAKNYITELMQQLNGGLRRDRSVGLSNRMLSGFKRGATMASLSVVIQQPTSIIRSMTIIDPKYFKSGFMKSIRERQAVWDELKSWAPVALIKESGSFDVDLGASDEALYFGKEYGTLKEKAAALAKDADYRNDVLGKAPEIADQMAWCYMWEACKNKIEAETNLKRGSDEFMQKAADVLSEAVRMTQVYDSRLTRSQMMRSPDFGAKMITTFMAEPTTSFNMLAYAVLGRVRGDKDALKAIGYVVASILLNSILVSAVYAMRDDDEDKTYGEKYVKSLIPNIIDNANPLNMLPVTRDVVSLFQGYDVERADMSLVSDVIKAFKGLSSSTKTPYRKIEDFAGSVANIFGIPAKNVLRDVRGMVNTAASVGTVEKTGLGTKYAILSGLGKDVSKGQQMYDALIKGDVKHYERVAAQYKTESAARTQLRLAMRASDERISLAAEARAAGNMETSLQIQNRIIEEGHFTQDDVIAAINAEYNLIKKEEKQNEAR